MIPKTLRISGFLSYQDAVELDFESFDLACISGANGAGKSSLLDAITWALFGQARRKDDALINARAKSAEVIFDFYYEIDLYRVQRSKAPAKTTVLDFFIHDGSEWRALSEHTLRETEARIQETLRLDYETFTNASFFLQGKADQFAQQGAGDRKRILSAILGLEVWEKYRQTGADRRRRHENELAAINQLLQEIEAELQEESQRRQQLKTLEKDLKRQSELRQAKEAAFEQARRQSQALASQRQSIEMLTHQRDSRRARRDERSQKLENRRAELQTCRQQIADAATVEAAYRNWQQTRAELERWEGIAATFHQYEGRLAAPRAAIESERWRLSTEIEHLSQQAQQATEQEQQILNLQARREGALQQMAAFEKQLSLRETLETELKELQKSQSEAAAENKRLKSEMDELKERIERLKHARGVDCPLCGKPLDPQERNHLLATLESQGKTLGDRFRRNQALLRQGEQRRAEIDASLTELRRMEEELRQQQRSLDQIEHQIEQAQQKRDAWKLEGAPRLQTLSHQLESGDYADEARAELARIETNLLALGYDAGQHEQARAAEQQGRASEVQMRRLESARATLPPLEREIEDLQKEIEDDDSDLGQLEASLQAATAQLAADAAVLPDLERLEGELGDLRQQENRLRMEVGAAGQRVAVLETQRQRQKEKEVQRAELNAQIARLKTLERAFSKDGVPALLIEQALPEIEAQANDILDRLTSGAMSVRFETQREYKDKRRQDQRETLEILISDAAGVRDYEMYSGGEAFRVNFAIRLALSRILAQRAGSRLQTLVIDEGFGSQDAEGRQRLIEALNLVRADFAKVLVITHLEELKDAFPARIEVVKTSRGSQVSVVL